MLRRITTLSILLLLGACTQPEVKPPTVETRYVDRIVERVVDRPSLTEDALTYYASVRNKNPKDLATESKEFRERLRTAPDDAAARIRLAICTMLQNAEPAELDAVLEPFKIDDRKETQSLRQLAELLVIVNGERKKLRDTVNVAGGRVRDVQNQLNAAKTQIEQLTKTNEDLQKKLDALSDIEKKSISSKPGKARP